jgi:hypothetical protein
MMNIDVDDEVDLNIYNDDSDNDDPDEISSTISASTVDSPPVDELDSEPLIVAKPVVAKVAAKKSIQEKKKVVPAIESTETENDALSIPKKEKKKKVETETQPKSQGMFPDIPAVIEMEEVAKPKHKTLTFQEDPMQFHAKPRDLAKNALKRAREVDPNTPITNHIFSRVAFSALPLDPKLAGLLEKATAEVSRTLLDSFSCRGFILCWLFLCIG